MNRLWCFHVSFSRGAASSSLSVCSKLTLPLYLLMRGSTSYSWWHGVGPGIKPLAARTQQRVEVFVCTGTHAHTHVHKLTNHYPT